MKLPSSCPDDRIWLSAITLAIILPLSALADGFAPQSLPIGAQISYAGTSDDSLGGEFHDSYTITITSATTFQYANPQNGTGPNSFVYAKTGPNTATISSTFSSSSYSESESVQLTFSTPGGGSYTLSGDYHSSAIGLVTFTASGTFDYSVRGPISVSGRVLDAENGLPLGGVSVDLGGQTASSSASGDYSFASVSVRLDNLLTASKSGFSTNQTSVDPPPKTVSYIVPDIYLAPSGHFGVVSIKPKYDAIFLAGITFLNEYTATVSWGGHEPDSVEFSVNGGAAKIVFTKTDQATAEFNMALEFFGSLSLGANKIEAVAIDSLGERSEPFEQDVTVIPLPPNCDLAFLPFDLIPGNAPAYRFKVQVPTESFAATKVIPVRFLDRIGLKLAGVAELKYELLGGKWDFAAGVKIEAPGLAWGKWKGEFAFTPEAKGVASQTGGFGLDEVGVKFGFDSKYPILVVYFTDLVPGGQVVHVVDLLTIVGGMDLNSIQRLTVNGLFGIDADLLWSYQRLKFKEASLTPKFGFEALYMPNLFGSSLEMNLTGRASIPIRLNPPFDYNVEGEASFSLRAEVWNLLIADFQWVWILKKANQDIAGMGYSGMQQKASMRVFALDGTAVILEGVVLTESKPCPRPRDRRYLQEGEERFVGFDSGKTAANGTAFLSSHRPSVSVSPLEAFRSIGRTALNPTVNKGDGEQAQNGPVSDSGGQAVGQANLQLLQNVYPGSDPALASHRQELMLLYVSDNGSSNNLQFTDINWSRFDGTNWSLPATIGTNTQAEFSPRVAYDGNGDAIAVWERVADPNFNQTNLMAMAAQMEIVWAKWDHMNGVWSAPSALTTNGYLDHAPLLCGPMYNGTVLLTWTANPSNLLMGTNGAGSQVLRAEWNPANQTWSASQILEADLSYRLSQSLSGASNVAAYVWTQDLDGVLTNTTDQQVFYCAWSNGIWGAATQLTTDTSGNRNARASIGSDGHGYLIWQSGTNLILSRDFSTNTTLARADSQSAGFAGYAMTVGPAGNLALLWQEVSQAGSDVHYAVYDPSSATWSKDAQFFHDVAVERSFASVWDDVGNLTFAYNKVDILMTNQTAALEGGGTITITNVAQPGRVDLCVTKRLLIKDLALETGDFTASAENYLPGAVVTLSATVRNVGDLAVSNTVVEFYDGDPMNGGVVIANIILSDWLAGAATNLVSTEWVVPFPATNHVLYAKLDPANAITEFDEANNMQSASVGGTDLAVSLVSRSVETNGAVRVIAQVQNLGAPSATNSVLAIRRFGDTNAPLAMVAVPVLEPGRLAQVALELPVGTQSPGDSLYTLSADDTHVTGDVETNNNTSSFAVNLWIDSDGDGIPDNYEAKYAFLSSTNAADAQLDYDGDGLSNLAEYRAGTDPTDPASYLRMTSIGSGGTSGVVVAWGSATNKIYSLQRTSSLLLPFKDIAQHILSTPPENVYLDTSATNEMQFNYRVRLE